jgi:hypothetical protein
MDTNLPLGSVTYSRDKAVMELASGDEILKESGTSTYAYIVQEGDAATGEFTVVSATEPDASPETVILRNSVSEVVLTIPYIGFVVVAMQSLEGRIIIGLVILFIIILFILSELWKKRDDDEYDEDDNESGDRGNAQAASAEKTGDAERVATRTGTGTGYSENVTDNRGYGTVSQDTASIAAAMAGLESVAGRSKTPDDMPADEDIPSGIQADDASSNDLQADEASVNDTDSDVLSDAELSIGSVSGGALQEVPADENPEITVTLPAGSSNEPAVDAMNMIDRFVFEIRHKVESGGVATLNGIGRMSMAEDGLYRFEYDPDAGREIAVPAAMVETPAPEPIAKGSSNFASSRARKLMPAFLIILPTSRVVIA